MGTYVHWSYTSGTGPTWLPACPCDHPVMESVGTIAHASLPDTPDRIYGSYSPAPLSQCATRSACAAPCRLLVSVTDLFSSCHHGPFHFYAVSGPQWCSNSQSCACGGWQPSKSITSGAGGIRVRVATLPFCAFVPVILPCGVGVCYYSNYPCNTACGGNGVTVSDAWHGIQHSSQSLRVAEG